MLAMTGSAAEKGQRTWARYLSAYRQLSAYTVWGGVLKVERCHAVRSISFFKARTIS
jgi:hypothetical protein